MRAWGQIMRLVLGILASFLAAIGASGAGLAQGCSADMVCAERPQSIVDALQAQGYQAQLGRNEKTGNPTVKSAASGYNYTIYFFGCESGRNCTSLTFATIFENDGTNTPQLANAWNKDNRFSQMAVNDDGSLAFTYDVTTVGGLNRKNFADVVDWWQTMLGLVNKFFKEQPKS
jgi:hypothetical protein